MGRGGEGLGKVRGGGGRGRWSTVVVVCGLGGWGFSPFLLWAGKVARRHAGIHTLLTIYIKFISCTYPLQLLLELLLHRRERGGEAVLHCHAGGLEGEHLRDAPAVDEVDVHLCFFGGGLGVWVGVCRVVGWGGWVDGWVGI